MTVSVGAAEVVGINLTKVYAQTFFFMFASAVVSGQYFT